MANPNIVNVSTINAGVAYSSPANTTAFYILTNAASSGQVYKINNVVVANSTGSAATSNVFINSAAAGGGTNYPIVGSVSVPANASLVAVDKSSSIYLTENTSLVVQSGTSSSLTFTISYEVLS